MPKLADPAVYPAIAPTDDDQLLFRTGAGGDGRAALVQPKGYIDGLRMTWISGTQIQISAGAAYVPGVKRIAELIAPVTLTPSLAANTWYHVYLTVAGVVVGAEAVTTVPAATYGGTARAKTGDTSRRYIGSFRTGSTSAILRFFHNPSANAIDYVADINDPSLYVLVNGSATTVTAVSMATAVPMTSRQPRLFSEQTGAGSTAILSNSDITGAVLAFARGGQLYAGILNLNATQSFTYFISGAGQLNVWCAGYYYER